jgi:ribose 5-phosphate isomerase RpiB
VLSIFITVSSYSPKKYTISRHLLTKGINKHTIELLCIVVEKQQVLRKYNKKVVDKVAKCIYNRVIMLCRVV